MAAQVAAVTKAGIVVFGQLGDASASFVDHDPSYRFDSVMR